MSKSPNAIRKHRQRRWDKTAARDAEKALRQEKSQAWAEEERIAREAEEVAYEAALADRTFLLAELERAAGRFRGHTLSGLTVDELRHPWRLNRLFAMAISRAVVLLQEGAQP